MGRGGGAMLVGDETAAASLADWGGGANLDGGGRGG